MEEIIICIICKSEYSLLYENGEVVSATKCECNLKSGQKPLDKFFKEVLNAKNLPSNSKVSISTKASSKRK